MRWLRSVVLVVLAGLLLARAPAGEAGQPPSVEFLPGALEPGTWIEWSEMLRIGGSPTPSPPAAVLTARGVTACFGGPRSVPDRRLDSILAWSLEDGGDVRDRSAEGVQLVGLSRLNPQSLRIGQSQPDSADAAEWLEARGAVVAGLEPGRLLPRLTGLLRERRPGLGAARIRTPCASLLVSLSDATVVFQVLRSDAEGWSARTWIAAETHQPLLPSLWDRTLGANAGYGHCAMGGTLTCRRTGPGRTETLLRLDGSVGEGASGARWTEEHRAVRHDRAARWSLPVADPGSGCEISRVVRVGWNAHISSVSHAFRLPGHRCWTAPTAGMARACEMYVYPSPIEELHLDRLVGEEARGHAISLRASAVDAPVRERVASVVGAPLQGGEFTLVPSALGARRRLIPAGCEERMIEGMGRIVALGRPDGTVGDGQPLISEHGSLLGVVSQWGPFKERFIAPLDLPSVPGGSIEIPSIEWMDRLEARLGQADTATRGRLEDLRTRIESLATFSALSELEALAVENPRLPQAQSILAYARALRGEYAKAAEADGYVRTRWPADRILAVLEGWRALRDEVVDCKGKDHCELHARVALAVAPSEPGLQDAVLAALCRCEAYETAADLVLQLGLSRPGSVGDLRTVHAWLVREGDGDRAARVEALVRAASAPK